MKRTVLIALPILAVLFIGGPFVLNHFLLQNPLPDSNYQYQATSVFPNLSFDNPAGICSPNDGSNRLFVVSQLGAIYVFENHPNVTSANEFLDIRSQVHWGGLLGLAFHPHFDQNGLFYVNYLADNPLRTIIAQWATSADNPNQADNTSQKIIMEIPQNHDIHNGGQLAFGADGYLYIALGDGGPQGDPNGNAQNCSTLLGKILRINIDQTSQGLNYTVPKDNPFVGNMLGYREEIYAYGLRNPWRFSFDSKTGLLVAGDVGQDSMEEIDVIKKGKNYGWNLMEGTLHYNSLNGSSQNGLESPIWGYDRSQGNATIGGYVYRGATLPELVGCYIFGDYVSGRIWSLKSYETSQPVNRTLVESGLRLTSFGVDQKNELYFCAEDGKLYQLTHAP